MKYTNTIVLISLVIIALIVVVLLVPTISSFARLKTRIAETEAKIETQNEFLVQLQVTAQRMEENKELVAKIENALPVGPDAASLLDFLDESATRNGVNLEEITWLDKNKTAEGKVQDYLMSINFSGSYYSFRNFVNDIEKSSRIIDIDQIEFNSKRERGLPIEFKLYLRIHSYK